MALCDIFLVYIYRYIINISVTAVMIRIRKFLWRLAAEELDDFVGAAVGGTSVLLVGGTSVLSDKWCCVAKVFLKLVLSVSV